MIEKQESWEEDQDGNCIVWLTLKTTFLPEHNLKIELLPVRILIDHISYLRS